MGNKSQKSTNFSQFQTIIDSCSKGKDISNIQIRSFFTSIAATIKQYGQNYQLIDGKLHPSSSSSSSSKNFESDNIIQFSQIKQMIQNLKDEIKKFKNLFTIELQQKINITQIMQFQKSVVSNRNQYALLWNNQKMKTEQIIQNLQKQLKSLKYSVSKSDSANSNLAHRNSSARQSISPSRDLGIPNKLASNMVIQHSSSNSNNLFLSCPPKPSEPQIVSKIQHLINTKDENFCFLLSKGQLRMIENQKKIISNASYPIRILGRNLINNSFTVKFDSIFKMVGIGVVDIDQGKKLQIYSILNLYMLLNNGTIYQGANRLTFINKEGFQKGQEIAIKLNYVNGKISWQLNKKLIAQIQVPNLKQRGSVWIPFIYLCNSSDAVTIIG